MSYFFSTPRALKGFTLIELLVVIAIIGVLAAIVLASLGTVRQRGSDAVIQSNLDTVRTQSEVYATLNGNSYQGPSALNTATANNACGTVGMWGDPTITRATKGATAQAGTATIGGVSSVSAACYASASVWFIAVALKSDSTLVWCVDSTGKVGTTTAASITSGATSCP